MASSSSYVVIALLLAAVFSISLTAAYAEGGMTQKTSGGSMNIMLEPTWGDNGDYTVEVNVVGACFPSSPLTSSCPINEKADFPITVIPEFPIGIIGATMAALIGATVFFSRKYNIGFKI